MQKNKIKLRSKFGWGTNIQKMGNTIMSNTKTDNTTDNTKTDNIIDVNTFMNNVCIKMNQQISDFEIIRILENGRKNYPDFDINWADDKLKHTLLMSSVLMNRTELVRYLLSVPGINVNQKNICYNSALTYVLYESQIPILKLLVSREDLDVNIQKNGWTSLHSACYANSEQRVKILLSNERIDPSIRTNEGETALDIALSRKYYGIVKMLDNSWYMSLKIMFEKCIVCRRNKNTKK